MAAFLLPHLRIVPMLLDGFDFDNLISHHNGVMKQSSSGLAVMFSKLVDYVLMLYVYLMLKNIVRHGT